MDKGTRIIEGIIKGRLFEGECLRCKSHEIVISWSSSAPEQLEALCTRVPKDYVALLYALDQKLSGMSEDERRSDTGILLFASFKMLKELP